MRDDDIVWARFDEIDRVLEVLLDAEEAERAEVLARECAGDDELRRAVLELLQLSESNELRDRTPGAELRRVMESGVRLDAGLPGGATVGRYRVGRELGRGGMATVYEAERCDGTYRQTVALKVLHRGLDTDRVIRRFLAERQILSDFAHPNIARLIDGGTTEDGRPFLVMEKVSGEPIDAWSDHRTLDVSARIELFFQVTDAVSEAHRRLVVHRDLKPSNTLVDDEGTVKLLDFGIAKLIDPEADDAQVTQLGLRPLTRRYASPEQLRGGEVTTASDVYQLGLILYELLTGAWPFVGPGRDHTTPSPDPRGSLASLAAMDAAELGRIAASRATTPAGLRRLLRGDLETILRKALDPDPDRRYSSVADLASDLRLYRDGRPIQARPAPWTLRLRKWARRNPWAPPVAAVLALSTVAYVGTLTVTAQRLEEERAEALSQAARAERIKGFLIDLFQDADPFQASDPASSSQLTVADALAGSVARIRSELPEEPAMQADLLSAVAAILENLDRAPEARTLIDEALALRARSGQLETPELAGDLRVLAQIVDYEAPDSALTALERAARILRTTTRAPDPRLGDVLADLFAVRVHRFAQYDPALGEEALAIYTTAGPSYANQAAMVGATLAQAHMAAGRLDEAEPAAREALERQSETLGPDHPQTAVTGAILAGVLDTQQRYEEAVPIYRESIRVLESTAGPHHNQTLTTMNNLATTLQRVDRAAEATELHRTVLEARRRIAGTDFDPDVAGSLQNLAVSLKDEGRLREADSLLVRAYDVSVAIYPESHYLPAFPLLTRSELLLAESRWDEAEWILQEADGRLTAALGAEHYAVGVARCRLGRALVGLSRSVEGTTLIGEALEILRADRRAPTDYVTECQRATERSEPDAAGERIP